MGFPGLGMWLMKECSLSTHKVGGSIPNTESKLAKQTNTNNRDAQPGCSDYHKTRDRDHDQVPLPLTYIRLPVSSSAMEKRPSTSKSLQEADISTRVAASFRYLLTVCIYSHTLLHSTGSPVACGGF